MSTKCKASYARAERDWKAYSKAHDRFEHAAARLKAVSTFGRSGVSKAMKKAQIAMQQAAAEVKTTMKRVDASTTVWDRCVRK